MSTIASLLKSLVSKHSKRTLSASWLYRRRKYWRCYNLRKVHTFSKNCNAPKGNIEVIKTGNWKWDRSNNLLVTIALLSQTISQVSPSDVEENIAHLLTLARMALEKGDFDRSEAILEMGIKVSQDHRVYLGLPYIFEALTSIALLRGDIEKAERILVDGIEKLIQIGMPEDNHHVVDFKLRLSRIYSSFRSKELAEIGFESCLLSQIAKIENGDSSTRTGMLYINCLFWYGVHLIRNNLNAQAKGMLDKAYSYSGKIKGLSAYQEMVILYTLGDLNLQVGDLSTSLKHFRNAIVLGTGISSFDLPYCYLKLASVYYKMGAYDQARRNAVGGQKMAKMFNNFDVEYQATVLLEELDEKGN